MSHHNHEHGQVLEHHHSVWDEIVCHFPYAIFSVAFAMIALSLLAYSSDDQLKAYITFTHRLFHNFHFLHLLFAATGTVLALRKFSKNIVFDVVFGFLIPAFFCTVSDAFMPYFGGKLINLDMHFHWCFISELQTVLPFLFVGIINGIVMSNHSKNHQLVYSVGFHFVHIFVSSMASMCYLVSFGFYQWWDRMAFVFLFLIGAVLIPCTLADIVVPAIVSKAKQYFKN